MESNVYKKNLRIKSEYFNIAFATNDVKKSLYQFDRGEQIRILCITHFKIKVIELDEDILIHIDQLRNICDRE